jgi:hypothetical protein
MKIGEILRTIADAMEQAEAGEQTQHTAEIIAVEPEAKEPDSLFVPPLQLKIELLKRAVDVDNLFNHTGELNAEAALEEIPSQSLEEDELVALKRAAGINAAVIQELVNDEPLDD